MMFRSRTRRLALLFGLTFIAPSAWAAADTVPASPGDNAPAVTVVPAAERDLVAQATISGTLVARDEVLVSPEIDGYRITEVLAEEGDKVVQGQVLARLSRDMLERQAAQQAAAIAKADATVTQAENSITQAEAEQVQAKLALDRARQLVQSGSGTAATLENRTAEARSAEGKLGFARNGSAAARADLAQARAAQDELTLRLARTEIRAPVDGIVSRRTARVGAVTSAGGDALFRLIARGEIELEGEVVETRLPDLRAGDPATMPLGDGAPIAGRVRVVYPEVDRTTRLGKVRIALPSDPRLHIGAFARGTIEVQRTRSVAVPVSAVLYGADKGSTVLVVRNDDTVEARAVITGLVDADWVAITGGLQTGDRVVARAGSFLRDGDRIKPVPFAATVQAANAP